MRVFENRVLRRVFGPKRDEVIGEWRKLHNEQLNNLYSSPSIVRVVKSRRMRWAGHVARMGEERGVHRVLLGKPEGKRPLGSPRHRWEDNINTLRTGDANLCFCVTTVKGGLRKIAFSHALGFYALNYTILGAFFNLVLRVGFKKKK
jgi:hypothetical protein